MNKKKESIDSIRLVKEVWEKAVDTQMHFNEMSVKSRQLGISFVVAALGLAAVLLTREGSDAMASLVRLPLPFLNRSITLHVSAVIVLIAAGGLYAFMVLDLGVYHRMLRGAVAFGEELELRILKTGLMKTPKGMTEFISLYSRYKEVKRTPANGGGNEYSTKETDRRTAEEKIRHFYRIAIIILMAIASILTILFFKVEPIS